MTAGGDLGGEEDGPGYLEGLLARLGETRADLGVAVEGLAAEARDGERWCGEWTVKDLVCHIAAWEEACAQALESIAAGEDPAFALEHRDDEPFNARAAAAHYLESWDEALELLDESRQRLTAALVELSSMAPSTYGAGSEARRVADQAAHEAEHTRAIEQWRKERGL